MHEFLKVLLSLINLAQISDILYYEVLDIPLPEIQGLKPFKVAFHHATKDEVSMQNGFLLFSSCFLFIFIIY